MGIEENILAVRENIASAAKSAGIPSDSVKLVAVSKFKPAQDVVSAWNCGVKDFGENYVQEFRDKSDILSEKDILWHIIGPVQRNKVKYIAPKNVLVQSVDRAELAAELSRFAVKLGKRIPVLLQVNASEEETKSGCAKSEVTRLLEECMMYDGILVQGLMTIGPNTDDMTKIEECFEETRELFENMKKISADIRYLSMGMTNDYTEAIKHGANIVRVGRAIFGERPKKTEG